MEVTRIRYDDVTNTYLYDLEMSQEEYSKIRKAATENGFENIEDFIVDCLEKYVEEKKQTGD